MLIPFTPGITQPDGSTHPVWHLWALETNNHQSRAETTSGDHVMREAEQPCSASQPASSAINPRSCDRNEASRAIGPTAPVWAERRHSDATCV